MSKRSDYCIRLVRKATIIEANLGQNEKKKIGKFLNSITDKYNINGFMVDDHNECKCKNRSDVILMDDIKYCCDCLCVLEKKKKAKK